MAQQAQREGQSGALNTSMFIVKQFMAHLFAPCICLQICMQTVDDVMTCHLMSLLWKVGALAGLIAHQMLYADMFIVQIVCPHRSASACDKVVLY